MTQSATATTAAIGEPERLSPRDRTVVGVLLVATFVVILNETIMSVAIPVLMRELGITANVAQWLATAFMLTMAVVIPVTGFLIQRVPTKTLFVTAMGLFSTGTALAAFAPGFPVLLAARIVQGSGTAIMIPLLMTTIMTIVPERGRGRMMGNVSIVISVAPAIGPFIGGLLLTIAGWRWMFGVVLPIAVVALVIGGRMMTQIGDRTRAPIDILSVPLAALGFGGLVFALNAVGSTAAGQGGIDPWIPGAIGVLALAGFVVRQLLLQRTDRALLDFRPFLQRVFTAATVTVTILVVAMLGTLILLPIYLQTVLGVAPLGVGLVVLPGGVLMGVLAPGIGRLYDRVGPRPILIPGTVVAAAALFLFASFDRATPVWLVVVAHLVLSMGLAAAFTPLFTAGLGAVPHRFTSHGSAIFATLQQVGGAAGTALVVTVLSIGAASAAAGGAEVIDATEAGMHLAFVVAAFASIGAVVAATFVGRPAHQGDPHAVAEPA